MESVGLEPTHDPRYLFFWGSTALPTELRLRWDRRQQQQQTGFLFGTCFYLTTLMIRVTTDLVPSRFLAYNQLLNALTSLMVIAYIIMIGKVI